MRRVSAEDCPPIAGSPDAMRQTKTLGIFHAAMDGLRQALQAGDTGATHRSAAALLASGVHARLVLDLQLPTATAELRQAGIEANQGWLDVVTGLVREHHIAASEVADHLRRPASAAHDAAATTRYFRHPALGNAFVNLLDAVDVGDRDDLAAMRELARSRLAATGFVTASNGTATLPPCALGDVVQQACEATTSLRLARLESSLLRRSVDANMPAVITDAEAAAVDRMVLNEYQRGGPDGLCGNPYFQATPCRARSLEGQMQDARNTYTREIGGLRLREADQLVSAIQHEYEDVVARDPGMSSVQRSALLRQLSGEARAGIQEVVHLFDQPHDGEETRTGPARPWTGPGSLPAALVDIDGATWRMKNTGDSGLSAMEASMSRLFQLTGLVAPDAQLMDACDVLPGNSQHFASRYEPTFMDLGDFLTTPRCEALAAGGDETARAHYGQLRDDHAAAVSACDAVLRRAGVEHFWQLQGKDLLAEHAQADKQRFEALEGMNRMLPTDMRCDQVRHFIASRWLDNWDQLNFRMENFGYVEREGKPIGMTVDFGSCGPLGFRNLVDGTMLPKQASADIAMLQRPPSLFPIPDAYSENAADFDAMGTAPGRLHDTLRWPYGFQSDSVAAMLRPPAVAEPAVAEAMAEMGYRLALLPASAIEAVVAASWQVPANAPAGRWPDATQMVSTLIQRRDAMLQQYDAAQIAGWIRADPQRAVRVRQQVADGMRAALATDVSEEHEKALEAAHDRLACDTATASLAGMPDTESHAVTARLSTLQRLHDCNRRLAAALEDNREADVSALGDELLSPDLFGQLLVDLELAADSPAGRASSEANHAWLLLVDRLVQAGKIPADRVAHCLLKPFEDTAYPPNVGARAHGDPALGMAFIQLLETLMAASMELTPERVREGLLTAKIEGFPNYYAALAASGASKAWDQQLQQADLWPDSAEYIHLRSLWSWFGKQLHEPGRGNEPIVVPERAQQLARLSLEELVRHVDDAYGPRRVVELELPKLREKVYSVMSLTSSEENDAMHELVARGVDEAWRKAMAKHRLPQTTPVPPRMVAELQERTLRDYHKRMKALRGDDVEALIRAGEQRYRDAVLADAGMPKAERRRLLGHHAEEVSVDIRNMVRGAGGKDGARIDTAPIEQRVQQQAAVAAADITAQAMAEAQARAAEQARGEARNATEKGAATESERVARSVASTAALAVAAHAQTEARKAAERQAADKAAKEASARAARDAIIQGRQFKNEVETRLAMLRAPDVSGSSSSMPRQSVAQMEQRLRSLRENSPTAEPMDWPSGATSRIRSRTREYIDPRTGTPRTTTR
ncbi:hypothetical protein GCM10027214_37110 [Stenotrophomonas tumulicola]